MTSAKVVGRMTDIHDKESKEANSTKPATSTQRGPIVIQKTPKKAPLIKTKTIITPYDVAGSQIAKHMIPQTSVSTPAVSMRPK